VKRFISACNANDTFPQYLLTGNYNAKPSIETLANAMDVGDPSNFERFHYFLRNTKNDLRNMINCASYSDAEIVETMSACFRRTGYLLDPHGACGYRALKEDLLAGEKGVFLATAHPAKFAEVYTGLGIAEPRHEALEALRKEPVRSRRISSSLRDFRSALSE
jgi:threonine synthase